MTPNPNPSPELLPCPFCGGEATYQWHSSPECWIECQTCFAVGPNDKDTTTDQHVAAWNTRVTTPPTPAKTVTFALPGAGEVKEAQQTVKDALMDSQYLAGVTAGWNAAQSDDVEASLAALRKSREGHLSGLKEAKAYLAAVAAANDEGVVDDHGRVRQEAHVRGWKHGMEDAAKVADAEERKADDEIAFYDSYGGPPLPARAAEAQRRGAARSIAAAIRLLSQEGRK